MIIVFYSGKDVSILVHFAYTTLLLQLYIIYKNIIPTSKYTIAVGLRQQ